MADPVEIDTTREMRAPASAVWAVLEDLSRLPEWLAFAKTVEDVPAGPAQEGSTYTVKPQRAFEPTTHWRIAEVQPLRRQLHTSEMPMLSDVTSEIEVLEGGGGPTHVHVHWRGEPRNLMGRLMRPMFQKQIQANWEKSLAALDEAAARAA